MYPESQLSSGWASVPLGLLQLSLSRHTPDRHCLRQNKIFHERQDRSAQAYFQKHLMATD